MTEEAHISLPRTLVNRLLRMAQQGPGFSQGFVRNDAHAHFECVALLDGISLAAQIGHMKSHDTRRFAYYRAAHEPLPALTPVELTALVTCTALYLGIALDTKGVLQLYAWRLTDNRVIPLDVGITESMESNPQ